MSRKSIPSIQMKEVSSLLSQKEVLCTDRDPSMDFNDCSVGGVLSSGPSLMGQNFESYPFECV